MQDIIFSLELSKIVFFSLAVLLIYFVLLRKNIFFWYDPLLTYLVFNSASVGLVIYLYEVLQKIRYFYFLTFLLSTIGFLVGIMLGRIVFPIKFRAVLNSKTCYKYYRVSQIFLILSTIFILISNLVLFIDKGTIPILSDNPSLSKVTLYTQGWGIIRRTNLTFTNYIFAITLLNLYHPIIRATKQIKLISYFSILIAFFILLTTGSKASLLSVLSILFGVSMINLVYKNRAAQKVKYNFKLIRKFSIAAFSLAVLYMVLVISLSGVQTSAGDSFLTRLIASGDTFYFFYVFDIYKDFTPVSSFAYLGHILNPLLGFLKISPYEYPIGAYIILYSIGQPLDESFGPNAQHSIEGLLYFGKNGAFFYSAIIGFCVMSIRCGFLNKVSNDPTFLKLTVYIVLASIILNLPIEAANFFSLLFDTIIFGGVFFLISLIFQKVLK